MRFERDAVATAKRINRRWIVHGGLKETAEAYMEWLESKDPARLRRACELALSLVHNHGHGSDPKPWFYAGLFSLADADEARRFLDGHSLTWTVWCELQNQPGNSHEMERLQNLARSIADVIRQSL